MAFFEFALSGFWHFVGTVILVSAIGRIGVALVVGVVAAVRGAKINIGG